MAKKTNKHGKRIVKTHHPRPTGRGWLVLRQRWARLLKDTFRFLDRCFRYYFSLFQPKIITTAILVVGFLGMGLWINRWWSNGTLERINRASLLESQLQVLTVPDRPHPTHLFIQWFVDTDIKDGTVIGNNWTILPNEAVYIINSARPGNAGNIIVYGHNTREVMGNIRALKGYEKIKVTLSDGTERWYQVKTMKQVLSTDVRYLEPTTDEVLTLYTCAAFADAERFVVQAVPVNSL